MEREDFHYLGAQGTGWPHPTRGPWQVDVHFADLGDGVAEVVGIDVRSFRIKYREGSELEIRPVHRSERPQPVNVSLIRQMNLTEVIKRVRSFHKDLRKYLSHAAEVNTRVREAAEASLPTFEQPTRRGRPPVSAESLRDAANIYRAALNEGRHDPTKAVADELNIGRSTAGKYVMRARALGWLKRTDERRPGETQQATTARRSKSTKRGKKQ